MSAGTRKRLSLFDSTKKRQAMYEMAKTTAAERGGNWQPISFALEGMQGYLITTTGINLSARDAVKHISQLIKQHEVKKEWERLKATMAQSAVAVEIHFPDFVFILAREEYLVKSQLESLLDIKMPEDKRQNALKYFMENNQMRRNIPKAFTRMPTLAGDEYDLIDHEDLPNTIEAAVIRKTQVGGLEYILTFCTDKLVFPNGEKPVITGKVNFEMNRANIIPAENFPHVPTDQVWILENVLLSLLQSSCCPSLREVEEEMKGVDGVIIPGGFGTRGIEGKIKCAGHVRVNKIPFLGICYGFQMAVVEFARNVCGIKGASTEEIKKDPANNVICILPEQEEVSGLGGTLRLGGFDVKVKKGTQAFELYGKKETVRERFRHRFNVNTKFIDQLEKGGLVFSGMAPEKKIMQILELPGHPYFIGTQYHAEFTSRPLKPNPLYLGLVKAAINKKFGKLN